MTTLFIEPCDVLIFRDARPFSPGERSLSTGAFPPSGRAVHGALRAAAIIQRGGSLDDASTWDRDLGTPDDHGALRLTGPLLARRCGTGHEALFPMPADVVLQSSGWSFLRPSRSPVEGNWPCPDLHPLIPSQLGQPEKFDPGWMDAAAFAGYLQGIVPTAFVAPDSLYQKERRTGVHLEAQAKTAVEGDLYEVGYIRLNYGAGLLVSVDGLAIQVPWSIALGGERRSATVTEAQMEKPLAEPATSDDGWTRLRLYLATPGLFAGGWLPACLANGEMRGIRLRAVAAAIYRAMPVHGFDVHRAVPRATVSAVPAGSVYFIEAHCTADEAIAAFHGCSIADTDPEFGFGLVYTGGWDYV